MQAKGIRHLPVLDGDTLVGILSERDLRLIMVAASDEPGKDATYSFLKESKVADAMTRLPLTISWDESLREAAKRMLLAKINALPVVDEADKLVGIITSHDMLDLIS